MLPTDPKDLVVRIARAILKGGLTPSEGAHRMWFDVTTQFGDDPEGDRLH